MNYNRRKTDMQFEHDRRRADPQVFFNRLRTWEAFIVALLIIIVSCLFVASQAHAGDNVMPDSCNIAYPASTNIPELERAYAARAAECARFVPVIKHELDRDVMLCDGIVSWLNVGVYPGNELIVTCYLRNGLLVRYGSVNGGAFYKRFQQ
jgi:hypothetical protein